KCGTKSGYFQLLGCLCLPRNHQGRRLRCERSRQRRKDTPPSRCNKWKEAGFLFFTSIFVQKIGNITTIILSQCIELLLEKGINPNARDAKGKRNFLDLFHFV